MDKCDDDGSLYSGGEEPCPFCNTEAFIEQHADPPADPNDPDYVPGTTKEQILEWINKLKERYGYKH